MLNIEAELEVLARKLEGHAEADLNVGGFYESGDLLIFGTRHRARAEGFTAAAKEVRSLILRLCAPEAPKVCSNYSPYWLDVDETGAPCDPESCYTCGGSRQAHQSYNGGGDE